MPQKFLLQSASPLHRALQHVLTTVLSVPMECIISEGEHFAVVDGPQVHIGLLPMLQALRKRSYEDGRPIEFLGASSVGTAAAVNQWVAIASQLSSDAVFYAKSHQAAAAAAAAGGESAAGTGSRPAMSPGDYTSIAFSAFQEVENQLSAANLSKAFLCGTSAATIADVLLYCAINNHPILATTDIPPKSSASGKKKDEMTPAIEHKTHHPITMEWSAFVQVDPVLVPLKSAYMHRNAAVASAAEGKVFAKPSAEEIERRRVEKENAKQRQAAEKEAAAAAAAAAGAPAAAAEGGKPAKKEPAKAPAKVSAADDPQSLVILVGCMRTVTIHPEADRLYVEKMDLGEGDQRTIVSGLVEHYPIEQLHERLCLVIGNMKPRPLKGITSQGMVLCASNESGLTLISPPEGAKLGDRVLFGPTSTAYADLQAATAAKPQAPKQLSGTVLTELLSHLRTDASGVLSWKDTVGVLPAGSVVVPDRVNAEVR